MFLTDRRDLKQGIFGFHHENILPCKVKFGSLADQKSKRVHPKLLEQRLTMYVYMGNVNWCMGAHDVYFNLISNNFTHTHARTHARARNNNN